MAVPAISVRGLRKSFGDTPALDGIDLAVAPGTVFALLGPGGAGKTTVVRVLSALVAADAGDVRVGGHDPARDPHAVRALIGVTASRPVRTYPAALLRGLGVAMTTVGDPRIVLLDEPTAGLGPRARHDVWQGVRNLVRGGVTVLLTTRHLDEADQLADRVAVLDRGRLVAEGTPEELKRLVPGGHVSLRFTDPVALAVATIELDDAFPALTRDDDTFTLRVPSGAGVRPLRDMLDRLDRAGVEVESLAVHRPDLDDLLLALSRRTRRPVARHPVG